MSSSQSHRDGSNTPTTPTTHTTSTMQSIDQCYELLVKDDAFYIRPFLSAIPNNSTSSTATNTIIPPDSNPHCLKIDYSTTKPTLHRGHIVTESSRVHKIFGIVGIISLLTGPHLIVVLQRTVIGKIQGAVVFRIDKVAILPMVGDLAQKVLVKLSNATSSSSTTTPAASPEKPTETSSNLFGKLKIPSTFLPSTKKPTSSSTSTSTSTVPSSPFKAENQVNQPRRTSIASNLTNLTKSLRDSLTKTVQDYNLTLGYEETSDDAMGSMETKIVKEISSFLNSGVFYYNLDKKFDLTNSFQRKVKKADNTNSNTSWDTRFFWNEYLLSSFINSPEPLSEYITPIIQGFVEIQRCKLEDIEFDFILISRRCRERSGLRYQRRGIDERGNVANFVETEMIVVLDVLGDEHVVSYVQTRGSIPLFWKQSSTNFKPIPKLERTLDENIAAFKSHFNEQRAIYNNQLIVNLVELKGKEAIVGSKYKELVAKVRPPQTGYVEFDFHSKCKGLDYSALNNELLVIMEPELNSDILYYWSSHNNGILSTQKGAVRVNCVDCLDRTNVVQSVFSRYVLNIILFRLGLQQNPQSGLTTLHEFEKVFKVVWANNGDAISKTYAGTNALKGDFTRQGVRNLQGVLNDTKNSIQRMYLNNFRDHFRQIVIDFLLGKCPVESFWQRPIAGSEEDEFEDGEEGYGMEIIEDEPEKTV